MLGFELLDRAAAEIRSADALLIAAGAGMGVDSGLPDFRGPQGFWNAYPAYRKLGLSFVELANPTWFHNDPELAWGFYGHRFNLYQATVPHAGFELLRGWGEAALAGYFVFTSNVDGHFQRTGFDEARIVERHGSLQFLQCRDLCSADIWPIAQTTITVDPDTFRAVLPLPSCPRCGGLARPNVLMFNDYGWIEDRTAAQMERYSVWQASLRGRRVVAIELGAGLAVPTVRRETERVADMLIRINVREPQTPEGSIALALPALEALTAIAKRL